MKTFADVKRRFAVDGRLECVSNTYRPEMSGTKRTIRKVQTNALAMLLDGQADERRNWTWLTLPPAKDVSIIDADTFEVRAPRATIRYRFLFGEEAS